MTKILESVVPTVQGNMATNVRNSIGQGKRDQPIRKAEPSNRARVYITGGS